MRSCSLVMLALALVNAGSSGGAVGERSDPPARAQRPIDRHSLVTRHNVVLTNADPLATLQVGNGEFAMGVDITGLQTFPAEYTKGIQLGTQSQWGWGSAENPEHFSVEDVLSPYDSHGRQVVYADGLGKLHNAGNPERARRANAWLRENPYRLQLGRFGLTLRHSGGAEARLSDIKHIRQTLDLWSGEIESRFEFDGQPFRVLTVAHPKLDLVSVRVESTLLGQGRAGLEIEHSLAASNCFLKLACSMGTTVRSANRYDHVTAASNVNTLEVTLAFAPREFQSSELPSFELTRQAAARHWRSFWSSGGVVDLSASKDPRWPELERRIVLSQYLTAIQCAGSMPPQETGLAQNSWFGKFHLEMHWWHAAHFALWGRPELLARSMGWYEKILPAARTLAGRNGYVGARWPKMVGPEGVDSPSPVGGFLIWQQPHAIYLAELLWRADRSEATLKKYRELVFSTAEFMSSYAIWEKNCFVLGPPLIPAQESYGPLRERVSNPTFELAYWHWALQTAQAWKERLGMAREPRWDEVCNGLAKPQVSGGRYEAIAVEPYTLKRDHPSLLQAYGFVPPTPLVDPGLMRPTFDFVLKEWDWNSTWGWDYPVLAMTAARLGRGDDAVNALLKETPKNRFLPNGHNYQRPNLPLYLPGNGGLLAAVAMMAAGWDGAPDKANPGFPDNGQWTVVWEGLQPLP